MFDDGQAGESVMKRGSSGLDPWVVVVGDPRSEFVQAMVRLSREHQVEVLRCEDVYSAVATMARAGGRRVLVVGAMRELAREGGRFFRIAEANAQRCCCLVRHDPSLDAGAMTAAIRSGVHLARDTQEVETVFQDWLSDGGRWVPRPSLADLRDEDLHATEEELIALLGHQTDA